MRRIQNTLQTGPHNIRTVCEFFIQFRYVLCAASGRIQVLYSSVIYVAVLKLVFMLPWEQCNKTSIGRTLGVWTTFIVPFSVPRIVFIEYCGLICVKLAPLWKWQPSFPLCEAKVKLSLFLTKHNAVNSYWGMEV